MSAPLALSDIPKSAWYSAFWHRGGLVSIATALLYLATFDSRLGSPDESSRYGFALALARRGLRALPNSGASSRYPPLQSMLAALPMRLGLWLDGGADGLWTHRMAVGISLLAAMALIPLFYSLARLMGASQRRAAMAAGVFALTNPLWPYSKRFYSEPLSAALALGAVTGVLFYLRRGRRAPWVAGLVCLGLLPLNNLVVPVAVTCGLVVMLWRRWRDIAAVVGALGAGVVLAAVISAIRFGHFGDTGYGSERFTFHIHEGLPGLLLGPGRSVFLFAPLLFVALFGWRHLAKESKPVARGVLVAFGVMLLVISAWWCWWGGICWGPRLMLPILPVASIAAIPILIAPTHLRSIAIGAVTLFGLWVQLLAVSFPHDFDIYFWMKSDYSDERLAWFDWKHSVLVRMPAHFRERPWDMSSSFLSLRQTGPSVVELEGRPVSKVRLENQGDELLDYWSITDLYVVTQGAETKRVPAGPLGAKLKAFGRERAADALDGNPATRWSSGSKRLRGMNVTLDFGRVRNDVVRLELEHMPHERDFPNGLKAYASADGAKWEEVPARAALPKLVWHPLIFVLLALSLLFGAAALRLERARQGESV